MSYTALYRKFRPSEFEDVKGQDHIVTTLQNQIKANRIGHAYLFCGTRGTGKTTVLKVILYIHQALCRSEVQLMAPTGRAARRMVESTGCENASTMHLALGLLGDDTDFEPDFEYLSAGFLNVDEVLNYFLYFLLLQ